MLCLETQEGEVCLGITSHPEYKAWLLAQEHIFSNTKETWWNEDRNTPGGRYIEFHNLLHKLEEEAQRNE